MTLPDQAARDRIRTDLGATLVVEAAAGTGKTTELVARIVALLECGRTTLDRILAVTFTIKAAGEMKLRLRSELERARNEAATPEVRTRLTDALSRLEAAQIGTIHSVCADLLRERPLEARIDPLFEVVEGEAQERLYDAGFDAFFERALQDPPEGLRRVLRRSPRGRNHRGARDELRKAGWDLVEHRDFDGAWQAPALARDAELGQVVEGLYALVDSVPPPASPRDKLSESLAELERFATELRREEAVRGRDLDGLEAKLRDLSRAKHFKQKGRSKFYAKGVTVDEVRARRDAFREALVAAVGRCEGQLAALLHGELQGLVDAYESEKAHAGALDFLDLLLKTRDLLQRDAKTRHELQGRYDALLVDEFQDTDPLQAEILLLLVADDPDETEPTHARPVPGKLFVVGDPKQSIYRFRRADIAFYEGTKERLVEHGAEVLHLSASFRAAPSIQEAVNAAFAPRMQGGPRHAQAQYVPLAAVRSDLEGQQPAVVALPAPRIYGQYASIYKNVVQDSYPQAVGAFVKWLVRESGWTVVEDGRGIPVEARHVCLLFRRQQSYGEDVVAPYARALEARGIDHVLVGGRGYHAREETVALRNAAAAVEWPDDELRVFACLRGPFFALSDEQILSFRDAEVTRGRLHPLRQFSPDERATLGTAEREVAQALELLGGLHRGRNRRSAADTLSRLLAATRVHVGLAIWPAGEQALANVLRVLDLARRFEAGGATSFRAFVERLEVDAERNEAGEAPVIEEDGQGVRIMNVHKAKGLEFPVVVLCDPTAPLSFETASRHVDPARRVWALRLCGCAPCELSEHEVEELERDEAEGVRLAYVAATRARDLLVCPVIGDEEQPGWWLGPLTPALYPQLAERRRPSEAPRCPQFGDDSVLERPEAAMRALPVAPGLHVPQAGEHRVVWWDPKVLQLAENAQPGIRREELLKKGAAGQADAGVEAQQRWREARAEALQKAGVPSLRVVSPTAVSRTLLEPAAGGPSSVLGDEARAVIFVEVAGREASRPGGRRFGTLTHAVLALSPLDANAEALERLAAALGRALGATGPEIRAAARAALAALGHELLRRAAASEDCRREAALSWRLPDGALLEGVADLAFRDGARWVVVDFKTDERPAEKPQYRLQLQLYAAALSAATGLPAEAVLLAV